MFERLRDSRVCASHKNLLGVQELMAGYFSVKRRSYALDFNQTDPCDSRGAFNAIKLAVPSHHPLAYLAAKSSGAVVSGGL